MAAVTASATAPGSARHVPKPTEGILAPVLSSKNGMALAISNKNQHTVLNLDSLLFIHEIHIR